MSPREIADHLQTRFGERLIRVETGGLHPRVHVNAGDWRDVAEAVRHDPQLQFDWLASLSGIDYVAEGLLAGVYDLWSFELKHRFAIKVFTAREIPMIPSVCDLWPAANWQEREAYDLLGIHFVNHPNLKRILCADDWKGFPLRKDYVFPREYHGIPGSVELDWQQG